MIALFGPLKMVFGDKKGRFDPLGKSIPKEHTHHRNTFLGGLSENPRFSGWAVDAWKEPKQLKMHAMVQLHLYATPPHLHPAFLAATIFCIWGRTVDVIKHARFQVNRFRGFGAPVGRKWPSPVNLSHRPYNSVRTNVLHCDYQYLTVTSTSSFLFISL